MKFFLSKNDLDTRKLLTIGVKGFLFQVPLLVLYHKKSLVYQAQKVGGKNKEESCSLLLFMNVATIYSSLGGVFLG